MPNYTVQDFKRIRPEIEKASIFEYITNKIADNYCKGLNGKYSNRLGKGIQVATQATVDQLTSIAKQLIADRLANGAETRVNSSQVDGLSDGQKRALILALWSSRIPFINREGKIDIDIHAVYRDDKYMPPVDLSRINSAGNSHTTQNGGHEPTLQELENLLRRRLSRKGSSNE